MKKTFNFFVIWIGLIAFFDSRADASVSNQVKLFGKIKSIDNKSITVKSGNKFFTIYKEDLKYPTYKVGDEIEFSTTLKNIKNYKSRLFQK